ncbi:YbaN family protein [Paenibacillus sp. CAU 1782]
MKMLYIGLGFFFFGLGAVGVVLPLLPTTPFLLLSAFFFARGSERFNLWFQSTKLYRSQLEPFLRNRSMTLKSKITIVGFASMMLAIAFVMVDYLWARILILLVASYKYYYFTCKVATEKHEYTRTEQ